VRAAASPGVYLARGRLPCMAQADAAWTPCWCAECVDRRRRTSQAVWDAAADALRACQTHAHRDTSSSSGSPVWGPPPLKHTCSIRPLNCPHIAPIPLLNCPHIAPIPLYLNPKTYPHTCTHPPFYIPTPVSSTLLCPLSHALALLQPQRRHQVGERQRHVHPQLHALAPVPETQQLHPHQPDLRVVRAN
jgi:hypothetical protein